MVQELVTNFRNLSSLMVLLKRSVLLFFLFVLSAQIIQAQEIGWGVKGGMNFVNHYDSRFETNYLNTFSAGAFANFGFGDVPLSIQPEVFYTQKGSDSAIQETDIIYRGKLRTSYIEVPLLVKYTVQIFEVFRPEFFIGPSASFLLRSTFKSDIDGTISDIEPITNNTIWGAVGGLAINFPSLSEKLSLETRLSRGYTEIYKSGENKICCGEFNRPQKDYIFSVLIDIEF